MDSKKREYQRRWEHSHPELVAESKRRWRQRNRDKVRECNQRWRLKNLERCRENARKATARYYPKYYSQLKYDVLSHYSNGHLQCAECGKDTVKNLSIDHIAGGGEEHRISLNINSSLQFYLWLRKNNYPIGYRVLCKSCNSKQQPINKRALLPTTKMLMQIIAEKQISRAKDIIDSLESEALSRHAVSRALYDAVKSNKLIRISKGHYRINNHFDFNLFPEFL